MFRPLDCSSESTLYDCYLAPRSGHFSAEGLREVLQETGGELALYARVTAAFYTGRLTMPEERGFKKTSLASKRLFFVMATFAIPIEIMGGTGIKLTTLGAKTVLKVVSSFFGFIQNPYQRFASQLDANLQGFKTLLARRQTAVEKSEALTGVWTRHLLSLDNLIGAYVKANEQAEELQKKRAALLDQEVQIVEEQSARLEREVQAIKDALTRLSSESCGEATRKRSWWLLW